MLKPITKRINDYDVTFVPLPATSAASLDLRVASLIMPVLNALDLDNVKADVDIKKLLGAIQGSLAMLDAGRVRSLLLDSLTGCTIVAPGSPAVEVTSLDVLDSLFAGELESMYLAVFEAWRFNKLSPFKLADRFGVKIGTTATSGAQGERHDGFGLKLER